MFSKIVNYKFQDNMLLFMFIYEYVRVYFGTIVPGNQKKIRNLENLVAITTSTRFTSFDPQKWCGNIITIL